MAQVTTIYRRLTYLLVVSTFLLMLLGGYVKAIGAGLSCPDWPLCYGELFPFFDGGDYPYSPRMIFFEWFHRLWASLVGFLLLGIVYLSLEYRENIPILPRLGGLLILLFGVQVILGGLTVLEDLDELIVVFHLGNAILIVMLEMTIAFIATWHSDVLSHSKPELPAI